MHPMPFTRQQAGDLVIWLAFAGFFAAVVSHG